MSEDHVRDGESRRVLALSWERVGGDSIVEFGDLDRPGEVHRAIVYRGPEATGLSIGDECLIRFRARRNLAHPDRWDFVERCVEVEVNV